MSEPDLNNLRRILDEYERYARSVAEADSRSAYAKEILGVIAEARGALRPSADSTANFIDTKQVVERLTILRSRADALS